MSSLEAAAHPTRLLPASTNSSSPHLVGYVSVEVMLCASGMKKEDDEKMVLNFMSISFRVFDRGVYVSRLAFL